MSAILRQLARRSTTAAPQRSFSTFRALNAGKESALHHEGRAEEAEQAKQEQLRKQKEGKGEWHDTLASDSESIVKADRGETGQSTSDTISQLQKEGEKLANKK
ncbi:hypothetical protein K461DRAFT_268355 [Myriangium duriaei CBS 260.36]|uniref:Mitochondrial carrier protein pet8 n=1 Tax=Myriangium duriaei CBS 260.36 TaxID=1168546 RepID=A0A9P4MFH8_9PEZI|nr:hypothetical protein K461DRAFT_268355 [Myriangium duriaei CBS 260.36]